MARFRRALATVLAIPAVACAHYQRYQPAPLALDREGARYRTRGLDDPSLTDFLRSSGAAPADSGWTSRRLALAALYYRADLDEARSALAAARAAERTAGVRPPPSAETSVERAERPDEGKSTAWSVSLAAGLTFELGGKSAARRARARAATMGARLRVQDDAWRIAGDARRAAVSSLAAQRTLADQDAEARALSDLATLLRTRYAAGEISLAEVARAESDARSAALDATGAARSLGEQRVALARALAVSPDRLASINLLPDAHPACAVLDSVSADSLGSLALHTRADVGVALADYAVAEADLRIAVARQYPDVTIGPGILWDQGVRRWVLSLAVPSIPLHARGPIAEAEARRSAAAARVRMVEDSVLSSVESSVVACRSVATETAAADSLVQASARARDVAAGAYARGEVGRTDVAFAELALLRARRAQRAAGARAESAGAALEEAAGLWLDSPIRFPDVSVLPVPSRQGEHQ